MNSDDAACATLDELRGSIRKRDKGIGGFGHEQYLRIGAWPRYGIAAELPLLAIWPGRRLPRAKPTDKPTGRFGHVINNRTTEHTKRQGSRLCYVAFCLQQFEGNESGSPFDRC